MLPIDEPDLPTPRPASFRGARPQTFGSLDTHNYRLFFGGDLVSYIGSWMQTMAEAWLVLTLTGSGAAVGATFAFRFLPVLLFGLWGGVDRRPLRPAQGPARHPVAHGAARGRALADRAHRRRAGVDGVRARVRARARHGRRRAGAARVRRGDGRARPARRTRSRSTARCGTRRASPVPRSPACSSRGRHVVGVLRERGVVLRGCRRAARDARGRAAPPRTSHRPAAGPRGPRYAWSSSTSARRSCSSPSSARSSTTSRRSSR